MMKEVKTMLPIKLNLTEELAATLRELRLNHPVNGEILTAENLSKAIGNNRAWMSQIESRRLKKIKREDIIKIFKLLYCETDDYKAEYRAEIELMGFIYDEMNNDNKVILTGDSLGKQYSNDKYREYRKFHDGINYTEQDLADDKIHLTRIANNIIDVFMRNLYDIPSCIDHNNYINQFMELENHLSSRFKDTLFVLDSLPLSALDYATNEEYQDFIDSIKTISQKLHTISTKHDLNDFINELNAAKTLLKDFDKYKDNFSKEQLLGSVTLMLVHLSQYVSDETLLSLDDKIKYTNDLIWAIYQCSIVTQSKQLFNINSLPSDTTIDNILNKINELQSFLSNMESNPFIIQGKISKYFTT